MVDGGPAGDSPGSGSKPGIADPAAREQSLFGSFNCRPWQQYLHRYGEPVREHGEKPHGRPGGRPNTGRGHGVPQNSGECCSTGAMVMCLEKCRTTAPFSVPARKNLRDCAEPAHTSWIKSAGNTNSEGFLSMRDCRKGPDLFCHAPATYDVNDISGNLRFQKKAAGFRNGPVILPCSRRKIFHHTESGIFGTNPVLESISRLSGF